MKTINKIQFFIRHQPKPIDLLRKKCEALNTTQRIITIMVLCAAFFLLSVFSILKALYL